MNSVYSCSFPASPVSVSNGSKALEMCVRQPQNGRGAAYISMLISLLVKLNVSVEKCVLCKVFVCEATGEEGPE